MTTGERIRSRRLELGLTQEELARKLGYKTKSTLSAIEGGRNELKQAKIKQFAIALECDPLWLIGISDQAPSRGWESDSYCTAAADFLYQHKGHRVLFELIKAVPEETIDRVAIALELMIK